MKNAFDYGSRDAAIRTQTYSVVRRLRGLPHALFAQYWRDVHGPLCSRLPGLGFYVQHHFSSERTARLWPEGEGVRQLEVELDGAVEIGFADGDEAGRFIEASPLLFGDEVNVFGWDAAFSLPEGSKTFVDQDPDGAPNGVDRLYRLHVYFSERAGKQLAPWLTQFAEALSAQREVVKLRLHLPERYDNAHPQPPSPVPHEVVDDMLRMGVMEIGFASAMDARRLFESDAFAKAAADQAAHVQALAAVLVTHVYTFVRDGTPTMAGLRGSSVAEVIALIGATNHASDAVQRLFVRA
ncbi:EthD domain-containing protein [Rhodanobacter sp. BL-MT-08]